jgi:hypothetical protein
MKYVHPETIPGNQQNTGWSILTFPARLEGILLETSYEYCEEARHQWLTPVSLAIQEAEIRRIMVQANPGQIVCKTLS